VTITQIGTLRCGDLETRERKTNRHPHARRPVVGVPLASLLEEGVAGDESRQGGNRNQRRVRAALHCE